MRLIMALVSVVLLAGCDSKQAQAAGPNRASAVFAGGCFWCTESDFDKVPGVIATTSGYTGGKLRNPTYEQVSHGNTGHIESVKVDYDPTKVTYAQLASYFIKTTDPLDNGGSFCDRGPTYRSAFFVANPAQRQVANKVKARAAAVLGKPVSTLILPAAPFYPAEDYHQDYHRKNPLRYKFYRFNCGRDARLAELWGRK